MYPQFQIWRPIIGVTVLVVASLFATIAVEVEAGDTLSTIAERHDVTVAELIDWNDIADPDRIFVGATLIVSAPADGTPSVANAGSHVVTAGETLGGIAHRYGSTIGALVAANDLPDANRIFPGQALHLDRVAPPTTTTAPLTQAYTVVAGDTLHAIAGRFDTTAVTIATKNSLHNVDQIVVGQSLTIDSPTRNGLRSPAFTPAPTTTTSGPSATGEAPTRRPNELLLTAVFEQWGITYDVPQGLIEAISWKESNWDPQAVGSDGRLGIMQLSPETVELIEGGLLGRDMDPLAASDGIQMGARYLRYLLDRTHSEDEAVAAWRQGLSSVQRDGLTTAGANYVDSVTEIRDLRG